MEEEITVYITVNLLCDKNLQNSRIVNFMLTLQIFVFKIIVVGLIRLNHKLIRQIKILDSTN